MCPFEITGPYEMVIHTLEGDMHLSQGDWLIQGVKGEFYPCKADIFDATYEAVVEQGGWVAGAVTSQGPIMTVPFVDHRNADD